MSKIEQEFLDLTKIKTKPKEDRQKFLSRIFNAAETLFDDDNKDADKNWDEISEGAQEWFTEANKREKDEPFADFADVKAASDEEDDAEEDKDTDEAEDAEEDSEDASDEDNATEQDEDDVKPKAKKTKAKTTKRAAKADPKAKKVTAKGNGHDKVAKKVKEKGPRKRREGGKVEAILNVIYANPKKGAEQLHDIASAKGAECSKSTVSTVRSDFIRACNFLDKKGVLKSNPFAE